MSTSKTVSGFKLAEPGYRIIFHFIYYIILFVIFKLIVPIIGEVITNENVAYLDLLVFVSYQATREENTLENIDLPWQCNLPGVHKVTAV